MKIGSREWRALIIDGAKQLSVPLQPAMVDQFAVYAEELTAWNRTINLTSISAPEEIALKHFLDSIAPLSLLPQRGALLDAGTGGGFPGLPLKIASASLAVSLVDASRKKINFIKHIIRILKLDQAHALQARIEDLHHQKAFQQRYDMIVCRAFSGLRDFIAQAYPLLAPRGIMVAMKGRQVDQELNSLGVAGQSDGGFIEDASLPACNFQVVRYTLPILEMKRALIIVKLKQSD